MQETWQFWGLATALVLAVLGVVFSPLLRGGGRAERRARYDMQVFRDQLREIDADLGRGVLEPTEAEAVRVEVSRRLLAASDAEAREAAVRRAPLGVSRIAATGLAVGAALGAGAIYLALGQPGRPDQPLADRRAALAEAEANRPSQAEAEAAAQADQGPAGPVGPSAELALVERLRAVVVQRPDDVEGHRLLARSEASLGRWPAARAAQARVVELLGDDATGADHVDLAELMIVAAGGYISPEAEAELTRAFDLAPENPVARYYSGLALLQGGRADLAYPLWARLLQEGPPDAPWIGPIVAQIDEVALRAGQPAPAGPTRAEIDAAQTLPDAERLAMIEGMVAQLSGRLAADGGPPQDWAQLIRSLGVLGRAEEAAAIWREARDVFAADPEALPLLDAAAAAAGVPDGAP